MKQGGLCVILNGPPGCGKDTLAKEMAAYGFVQHEFKRPLYEFTAKEFSVNLEEFEALATDPVLKEKIWNKTGRSPRDMLIYTSEDKIKPNNGSDFFGKKAAEYCKERNDFLAVFSDGGFRDEIKPLLDVYNTVLICKLFRKGYDFSNDSRRYVTDVGEQVSIELQDGKIQEGLDAILRECNRYL